MADALVRPTDLRAERWRESVMAQVEAMGRESERMLEALMCLDMMALHKAAGLVEDAGNAIARLALQREEWE